MKRQIRLLVIGGVSLCIIALIALLVYNNSKYRRELADIKEQLHQATEEQKEAVITRRISTQMEEIAYQQKEISDIRRQEAINQTEIAGQMRAHAERERAKAETERGRAIEAQQNAEKARAEMETQKNIADKSREYAVREQMRADTLARLALGRSLGSQAVSQYNSGNKELAHLLCYAAWKFTSENNGNIYHPAILDPLSLMSNTSKSWSLHRGDIRDMITFSNPDSSSYILTASGFGELFLWRINSSTLTREGILINDPSYNFRRMVMDYHKDKMYLLSYNGHIVIINRLRGDKGEVLTGNAADRINDVPVSISNPAGMELIDGKLYIVSKNGEVYCAETDDINFRQICKHDRPVTAVAAAEKELLIGDEDGEVYNVLPNGEIKLLYDGVKESATCILGNNLMGLYAIGYKSGRIVITDTKNTNKELYGHISPISEMKVMHKRFYTSSMDRTVRIWNATKKGDNESSVVLQSSGWINKFYFTPEAERIIAGGEKGELDMSTISPYKMADEVRKLLSRNFTQEEWEYYVGEISEYTKYVDSE